MDPEKIAFIGLGHMGLPFCRNLIAKGYEVHGFDIATQALEALEAAGGRAARSVSDACSKADYVITMLPDGNVVRDVLTAPDVLAAISRSAVVIDMSSSEPFATRQLGASLAKHGIALIDAPVSGGVKRANEGSVSIMAGGESETIDRVRGVLTAVGSKLFEMGPLGSGHAVKALNNYVSAAGLQAACEALLVTEVFGIDASEFVDVLNQSTGRNNSTETKIKPFILSGTYASGFGLSLMAKDIRNAEKLAQALDVSAPGLTASADFWTKAAQLSDADADHTEIYRFMGETLNGRRLTAGGD
ncbi:MAG: NAD(P)-dependent oxidoreductase [Pseudomonadota bacterium]